jgi:hypothetical protein
VGLIEDCKNYLRVLTLSDISKFSGFHSGTFTLFLTFTVGVTQIVVVCVVILCRHVGGYYPPENICILLHDSMVS